jgi:hypothetical protein
VKKKSTWRKGGSSVKLDLTLDDFEKWTLHRLAVSIVRSTAIKALACCSLERKSGAVSLDRAIDRAHGY